MEGHLITVDGHQHEMGEETIKRLLGRSERFWLDLACPDPARYVTLLRDVFGFHPLAVEDAEHFGQRPKIDTYEDFALLVVYGASPDGRLVEVHCFYTADYLVTVHHEPCQNLTAFADRMAQRGAPGASHVMLLYRVIDSLVDGYFPVLATLDDQIDDLEDDILARPTDEQLGRLFDMKRSLIALRKVVTPQRDLFATVLSAPDLLPGMTPDAERYFRDLYDHLIRISDLVDSYRDLLSGALDTHLSTVSNRLNVVMKQLTLIATVFLPLTFLTGFFGQNFSWMINRISSVGAFVGLGLALPLGIAVALFLIFRRQGWLAPTGVVPAGSDPEARPRRRVRSDRRIRLLHPAPAAPESVSAN
ncbi:MAG TPA: magnesium transporter CorA family protein [Acidimicrobiales bacterium]|nr:magnesium transporter CorA family protein [Acidimicrobiales bacterium]